MWGGRRDWWPEDEQQWHCGVTVYNVIMHSVRICSSPSSSEQGVTRSGPGNTLVTMKLGVESGDELDIIITHVMMLFYPASFLLIANNVMDGLSKLQRSSCVAIKYIYNKATNPLTKEETG